MFAFMYLRKTNAFSLVFCKLTVSSLVCFRYFKWLEYFRVCIKFRVASMGQKFQYSVPFNYPVALLFVLQILAHHGPEDIWADVILSQNNLADPLVPHGVLAHSSIFERQSGCSNSMRRYLAKGGGGYSLI